MDGDLREIVGPFAHRPPVCQGMYYFTTIRA